jgi:hypothetical protein
MAEWEHQSLRPRTQPSAGVWGRPSQAELSGLGWPQNDGWAVRQVVNTGGSGTPEALSASRPTWY